MGTVFQVPWTRIDQWPEGLQVLRDNGFTVAAFALTDEATSLDDLTAHQPDRLAVIFGAEGDGLSRRVVQGADLVVKIPMAGEVRLAERGCGECRSHVGLAPSGGVAG